MIKTGQRPGKGLYVCTRCRQTVVLDDDTDTMPPCPKCRATDFLAGSSVGHEEENMALQIPEDIYFTIIAKHSRQAVDVETKNEGANIRQWPLSGNGNQQFRLEHYGENWAYIRNRDSNQCVDVDRASQQAGANILQWSFKGGPNQLFQLRNYGAGWVSIFNRRSQKVLTVHSQSVTNGANIVQDADGGSDNQRFRFALVNPEWRAQVSELNFINFVLPTELGRIDIMTRRRLINNSSAKIIETISSEISKECTFTWRIETFWKFGASLSITANVPYVGPVTVEFSGEVGETREITAENKITRTYGVSREIIIEPRTAVSAEGYVDWVDEMVTEFDMKVWLKAKAECTDGYRTLSGEELRKVLMLNGLDEADILQDEADRVHVQLHGEFTGSFGVITHFKTDSVARYRRIVFADPNTDPSPWHTCANCPDWPTPESVTGAGEIEEIELLNGIMPTDGDLCEVCLAKENDKTCAK